MTAGSAAPGPNRLGMIDRYGDSPYHNPILTDGDAMASITIAFSLIGIRTRVTGSGAAGGGMTAPSGVGFR